MLQSLHWRYCYCNGNYYYNCFVTRAMYCRGDRILYIPIYVRLKNQKRMRAKRHMAGTEAARHHSRSAFYSSCILENTHTLSLSLEVGVFEITKGGLYSFYARLAFIIWSIYVGAHFWFISLHQNHLLFQCQCHASKHEGLVQKFHDDSQKFFLFN